MHWQRHALGDHLQNFLTKTKLPKVFFQTGALESAKIWRRISLGGKTSNFWRKYPPEPPESVIEVMPITRRGYFLRELNNTTGTWLPPPKQTMVGFLVFLLFDFSTNLIYDLDKLFLIISLILTKK